MVRGSPINSKVCNLIQGDMNDQITPKGIQMDIKDLKEELKDWLLNKEY